MLTRARALAGVLLVVPVMLAGCTQDDVEGTDDEGIDLGDRVTGVAITQPPIDVPVGAPTRVCWKIAGLGEAVHTDLHVDAQPHVAVNPLPHEGETFPPEDAHTAEGHAVPGTYCATIRSNESGLMFVQAHVIPQPGQEGFVTPGHHWNVTAGDPRTQ